MNDILICPKCNGSQLQTWGHKRDKQQYKCRSCGRQTVRPLSLDKDVVSESTRLAKQNQSFRDRNAHERKAFREHARIENAVEEYNRQVILALKHHNLSKFTQKHRQLKKSAVGVIQFSDVHFNELVHKSHTMRNEYDFKVAAKRCELFVSQATNYFLGSGVNRVVLAMTGDMLNSDRRISELLNMATNRSQATVLAADIMSHVIHHLNQKFNVTVTCVSGNESRVGVIHDRDDLVATDNFDWTIYHFLEHLFRGSKGVEFVRGGPRENVVSCNGQNVLMMHGESIGKTGVETKVQQIVGKWNNKGVSIDFIIFGHLHSARIGDTYARSSSMVGSNAYSDDNLQLVSRASQNIHIFHNNGRRDSIKIDLQNTDDIDGYPVDLTLESYNAKSSNKSKPITTIHRVVV